MSDIINLIETNFINILFSALIGLISYIGLRLKGVYEERVRDDTKRKTVKTVVYAVERLYSDLDSDEKLLKAQENIESMLHEKGIEISEVEMRMLIEEVCNCLNDGKASELDAIPKISV